MSTLKTSKLSGIVDAKLGIKVNNRNLKANFHVDSSNGAPLSVDSGGNAQPGDYFWDSNNSSLKVYVNDSFGWTNIGLTDSSGVGPSNADTAFLIAGTYYFSSGSGNTITPANGIETVRFDTPGNATDFADITVTGGTDPYGYARSGVNDLTCGGDHNRIVFGAANVLYAPSPAPSGDLIDETGIHYITCATAANSVQFGSLQDNSHRGHGGDGGNGVMHFRTSGTGSFTIIQQVTIQTTGDATDFIDLNMVDMKFGCMSCNDERGIAFGGRQSNFYRNYIDYFTPGNASVAAADFGDLHSGNTGAGPSTTNDNISRTLVAEMATGTLDTTSATSPSNAITYIDTQTVPSNSSDFGDLSVSFNNRAGSANSTYAIWFGGSDGSAPNSAGASTVIDYVTIATPGNATDFGDCSMRRQPGGSEGIG